MDSSPRSSKSPPKKRVDTLLVDQGYARSLEEARVLILAGLVLTVDQAVTSSSLKLPPDTPLRLKSSKSSRHYLSRAYLKLQGAIEEFQLEKEFQGAVVLDIGSSTGGFVQCVLEHGAAKVLALDVGTNQLAWELRQDPRVVSLEGQDIRDFKPTLYEPVDWILADVSFNSLARLSPQIYKAATKKNVRFLLLVKPQFELRRDQIPEGGIVNSTSLQEAAVEQVTLAFSKLGLTRLGFAPSRTLGQKGNQEFFLWLSCP
ncbi:MAG: TlyA family RNA methyltransferase [Oligoflexales bacterium]|nr:TlyA family RNA methyltransferase [Oligoflexales bacterium]